MRIDLLRTVDRIDACLAAASPHPAKAPDADGHHAITFTT